MKKNKKFLVALSTAALAVTVGLGFGLLTGCSKDKTDPDLLLHLTFDEGKGTTVKDKSGKQKDATVEYVFTAPEYQPEAQDPQWRETGAVGGSLLMDGYSNRISYRYSDFTVSGGALTVQAWVAPRMFEWDAPEAAANGEEHLTAVVSQYNDSNNQGFLLGYQRHGAWSFQVGVGDRFYRVWDNGHRSSNTNGIISPLRSTARRAKFGCISTANLSIRKRRLRMPKSRRRASAVYTSAIITTPIPAPQLLITWFRDSLTT